MTDGRILVVEDDPRIAAILHRGLQARGFEVTVAEDGSRGRAAWEADRFDAVLLDVMLPGIDGISLCAERRRAGDRTPVIMLSAREDDDARTRGLAAGAADYVTKPFSYRDLLSRLDRLLAETRNAGP